MPSPQDDWYTPGQEQDDWYTPEPEAPKEGFGSGYGLPSLRDIGTTALKIPGQLGETLVGLGDVIATPSSKMMEWMGYEPGSTLPSKALKGLGYDPEMLEKQISSYESPELKQARQEFGQAKGISESASSIWRNPGLAALSLEESAPYLAVGGGIARPLVRAGMSPIAASAIGEAIPTIGQQASQIRRDQGGEFDLGDAATAVTSGTLTGLISGGSGKVAEYAGLPDIDKLLADPNLNWRKRLPAYLGGIATEGLLEEAPQSMQEQAAVNLATGKPIGEGVASAGVMGAVTGGLMGAGTIFRGGAPASTSIEEYRQQQLPFGPPEPTQQRLFPDPLERYRELDNIKDRLLTNEEVTEMQELRKALGVGSSQPSKIWPGIDPVTRRFRKIYPEATQQGELPFEPPTDETGQMSLNLGPPEPVAGGPRAKPVPPQAPPAGFTPSGPVEGDLPLRNPLEAIGDEEGTADFNRTWNTLRQMLGRDPSLPELQQAMDIQNQMNPPPPPTTEGEYVPPMGFTGEEESPGRMLEDDTLWRLKTGDALIHNIVRTADRPVFDDTGGADPMSDRMAGIGIVENIPAVDSTGQQLFPGFGHSDLPPRDVPPEGPYPEAPDNLTQGRLPLHDEKWWQRREQKAARAENRPVEGLDPNQLDPNFDPEYAKTVLREVPPGPPGLSVTGEGGVISVTYRAPDGSAIADAMIFKAGVLGPDAPATVSSFAADKSKGMLYGRAVAALKQKFIEMGVTGPTAEYSPDTRNFVERMGQQQAPTQPTTPEAPPQKTQFEEMFGLEPGQEMSDEEIERVKDFHRQQLRDMYIGDEEAGREAIEDLDKGEEPQESRRPPEGEEPPGLSFQKPEDFQNEFGRKVRELQAITDVNEVGMRMVELDDAFRGMQEGFKNGTISHTQYREARWMLREAQLHFEKLQQEGFSRGDEPQEMKVSGVKGKSGLHNVALGGADPRVWDVMATSLYSGDRATIVSKELLQNAFDEHRIAGTDKPVRMVFNSGDRSPLGEESASVTVKDEGRGLTPDQIYTVLTDLGKTGKADEESASGGFGMAKAAPFGAGKYVVVKSVVKEGNKKVEYSFQGTFTELKNQGRGVAVNKKEVPFNTPTGLMVTTHFDKTTDLYDARYFAENMTQNSPSVTSDLLMAKGWHMNQNDITDFLERSDPENSRVYPELVNKPSGLPKLRDTIITPGAKIRIHYNDPDPTKDHGNYYLTLLNKGLYQNTTGHSYGNMMTGVPPKITVDIVATVKEGVEGYPFTANREQLDRKVQQAIDKWIDDNIKSGAQRNRITQLQSYYDGIKPIPGTNPSVQFYDEGNRFTPDEVNDLATSPEYNHLINTLESVHSRILEIADSLGWTFQGWGVSFPNFTPSARLKKFGILHKGSDRQGTTMGIHIPRADDISQSAILINLFEHVREALRKQNPVDHFASAMIATIAHEQAHIPGGSHDQGHSYRDADLRGAFGARQTIEMLDELMHAIGDGHGNINPEILRLLSIYEGSRQRQAGGDDALLATGINSERPNAILQGEDGSVIRTEDGRTQSQSFTQENLPGITQGGTVRAAEQPPHARRYTEQDRLAEKAEEVVAFQSAAKQFEESGDLDRSRRFRAEANKIRNRRDYATDPTSKAEEFLVRARYEKNAERKEELTTRANRIFWEQAGQLLLEFDPKQNLIDNEFLEQAESAVDIEDAQHGISHNYARMILDGTPDGPPGLKLESKWVVGDETNFAATYRNPAGKPIAYANFTYNMMTDRGETGVLVADKDAGALYGRALMYVGREIFKRNALEPSGMYSIHTAKLLKRLRKLLSDPRIQKFLRDEKGELDLSALGTHFDKVNQYAKQMIKSGRVASQKMMEETKKLVKDETGAMPIPSWKSVKSATGWGQGRSKPTGPPAKYNALHEVIMLPAGATTTLDMSAPGRQGLGLIHTPQFWKALIQMPRGLINSEFEKIDRQLRAKQIFQPIPKLNGKPGPSIAEEAGLQLMVPASSNMPGPRAQQIASRWLETGGFLGPSTIKGYKNLPRAAYFHTLGYPVRASNRAFITFLNTLRANRFEYLMSRAEDIAVQGATTGRTRMPGVMGSFGFKQNVTNRQEFFQEMNPYSNLQLAREIADFVNTATGAGPLKTHVLPFRQAEVNLEKAATALSMIYFSPGLVASRVRMLNPNTYVMATPQVRKEYMKSALATAAAWYAFTHMLKMALGDEAEIGDDITSADFGKVRIGDTRLDVAGGFQQFLVFYARMWRGGTTSAATGEFREFGEGFRAETQLSNAMRFQSNKMNPVVKFAYDLADADAYAPFHVYDRMAQLAIPLYLQDIYELVNENPLLLPIAAPVAMFGGGTQMYGKGESVGKLVDPEQDWLGEGGGGVRSLAPWNWGKDDYEMTDFPFQEPE